MLTEFVRSKMFLLSYHRKSFLAIHVIEHLKPVYTMFVLMKGKDAKQSIEISSFK